MIHPPYEMALTGPTTCSENILKTVQPINLKTPPLVRSGVFKFFPQATSGFGLAHLDLPIDY
jgi:hypothetical protein